MKGILSLDFVVAMIVVMILASMVITFAYFQQEKIVEMQYKANAELLATDIGSVIDRAYAITGPNDNLTATITPHDISQIDSFLGILVSDASCHYNITNGVVYVKVDYSFAGTGRSGSVIARYPTVLGKTLDNLYCGVPFRLSNSKSGWVVSKR